MGVYCGAWGWSHDTHKRVDMSSEPALIMGAVNAGLALGIGFGLHVTSIQAGLINAFVAAVIAVIIRQNVTPTR